ncbi:hypothetical protein J7643_11535 [bacterium]|nr:hypothetical protein [bacterium]
MHRATRMIPLALALVVGVAPAAFAKNHLAQAAGTQQQQRQNQKMTGMQQMLPGGLSVKGQLDHAYSEALNVQSALAMDMEDMAKNHLANVKLIIAHLEQSGAKLDKPMTDRLSAIRSEADKLDSMMGDRNAALKGSAILVSRFVTFYDQMASAMPMGGGGAMARPMKSATELLASAGDSAAMTQSALAGRDFATAVNHARDVDQHLKMAGLALVAQGMTAQSNEVKHVKALQQDSRKLVGAIESRSASATKQAGQMVDRIGTELMLVANATMGGGGGMSHPEHR